jgi:hypothetical protein
MKQGTWVRILADGREGHVVGSGIDGLSLVVDGRLVHVHASKVEVIPTPSGPEPVTPARRPQQFQTSHEPPPTIMRKPDLAGVLVSGKWSDPQ